MCARANACASTPRVSSLFLNYFSTTLNQPPHPTTPPRSLQLEMEIAKKKRALDECLHEYYTRQYNSENVYKRIMAKASTQQEELGKLEKRLDAVRLNMGKVRKERYTVQKEVHKLQVSGCPSICLGHRHR